MLVVFQITGIIILGGFLLVLGPIGWILLALVVISSIFKVDKPSSKKSFIKKRRPYLVYDDYDTFSEHELWCDYEAYCLRKAEANEFRETFLNWYRMWGRNRPHSESHRLTTTHYEKYKTHDRKSEKFAKNRWREMQK